MAKTISEAALIKALNTKLSTRRKKKTGRHFDLVNKIEKEANVYRLEWKETKTFATNINQGLMISLAKNLGILGQTDKVKFPKRIPDHILRKKLGFGD